MNPELVRLVTVLCLTVLALAAIIGLTVVAVLTDRDLANPERFTLAVALVVGVLGGLSLAGVRRHHRWRLERDNDT